MHRNALGALLLLWLSISAALAEEVTLRALSAFAEGTYFAKNFERMIEQINAQHKGVLQIRYIGGPRAIPTMEAGNALRNGVVDIASLSSAFYANLMPEGDAHKLARISTAEQRRNGTWEYFNKLHNEKVNAWYLAKQHANIAFHIYLNKPPAKGMDMSGLKLRANPVYRDFFTALGASTVIIPPGEIYTALERGVVDGYGWPTVGIFDLGWHERTKYRIDPPFYAVDVTVLVNLAKWKSLAPAQQKVLNDAALWLEGLDRENDANIAKELERQAQAGVQTIRLSDADAKRYLERAYQVGWDNLAKISPVHAPKLRMLLDKH
ncbi:MAG: TRAP transporter substrate-binding protein DctP [Burkholderiales bacterium]